LHNVTRKISINLERKKKLAEKTNQFDVNSVGFIFNFWICELLFYDAKKVKSRVNLVRKLVGTKWGSNAQTLRTASIALVYLSAEYCAPVWLNSAHVHKLDVQLINYCHSISAKLQWFPVLSNIALPKLRREATLFAELKNSWINGKSLLFEQIQEAPALRLRSRNLIWIDDPPILSMIYWNVGERCGRCQLQFTVT
jgi:hypothetical protein